MRKLPRLAVALLAASLFAVPAFAGKAARIELGRRLFMDPTVSRGARFSCASCHSPEHGFSDPRTLSEDENGKTTRHSQPLLDLKDGVGMHWDGEFFRVRELLVARLASTAEAREQARDLAREHFAASRGEGDRNELERRLRDMAPPYYEGADGSITWAAPLARRLDEEGRYASAFRAAFGSSHVTTERLVAAMEAYIFSLKAGTSAYDRDELSPAARRGLALFRGKANCASCHEGERFTDDLFHNTGVAIVPGGPRDGGRASRSFVKTDTASFKTPSLRDVARRAPYMHDGTFPTLLDVVTYYNRGGTNNEHLDPKVRKLDLDQGEIEDLVAFLESLTSDERPGLGRAVQRSHETRVRIEDLDGKPMEGLRVEITPFGDRLGSEGVPGAEPPAVSATTDKNGWLSFRFPAWTHVTLSANGLAIDEGQPLPDCVREARLVAVKNDATVVRVIGPGLPDELLGLGDRNDDITLRRVRRLQGGVSLYVAERPLAGSTMITFRSLPKGAVGRRYAFEIGKGFSTAIDLRPDPEVRVASKGGGAPQDRSREPAREATGPATERDLTAASPPRNPSPS